MHIKEKQDRAKNTQSPNLAWGTESSAKTDIPKEITFHGYAVLRNSSAMKNFTGQDFEIINF